MRLATILLTVLLTGCQNVSPLDRWLMQPAPSVMPFWDSYQRCVASTDVDVLMQSIAQLEQAMLQGSEPPDWIKPWGDHVVRQPLRTAVDPRALSAACTIRTASIMADRARAADATALYQRVITQYPDRELAYYVEQAKGALAALPPAESAFLARR